MKTRIGFTLVELLVVIAIIGVLIGMLVPAVQMVREAARRTACENNVRQIGIATLNYESSHQHLPTNGWGYRWIGDPNIKSPLGQPGSWIYNILPFMEQNNTVALGQSDNPADAQIGLQQMLQTPVTTMNCPSRRNAELFPVTDLVSLANLAVTPESVAKSDYAINGGDQVLSAGPGPNSSSPSDLQTYPWPDFKQATGVAFLILKVQIGHITDGTSNTYLVGEKYVPAKQYESSEFAGDDHSMFVGDDADNRRWTISLPISDRANNPSKNVFGGPHPTGCVFGYVDGSVHFLAYDRDVTVHRNLGNRLDGNPVSSFQ